MCTGFIGNTCLQNCTQYIDKSFREMYKSKYAFEIKHESICKNIALCSIYREGRILRRADTVVAFDGYLLDQKKKGNDLLNYILDLFIKEGPTFPKLLRGSFQIAIVENYGMKNQTFFLYSDHNASRPVFYGLSNDDLFFGPQISSVAVHIHNKQVYWPSVVQFLIGGYFFAGTTLIEQVKLLCAGEYLSFKSNQLEVKKYFNYKIEVKDTRFNYRDTQRQLSKVLNKAILDSWYHAQEPAILLSGGYDSRYIFYTIAESVNDTSKLRTITWGQNLSLDKSDAQIARNIANKFATKHIEIEKKTDKIVQELKNTFLASSGMTDNVFFHANELTICQMLREKHGILSLFRGEECFGLRRKAYNYQNALGIIGMSYPEYVYEIDLLFSLKNNREILYAYIDRINKLLSMYKLPPNALKDTLHHNQKQAMAIQPTNYFKYHYQEIYNPLIDPEVLSIVQNLPEKYRIHKRLFKECLCHDFPNGSYISTAKYTNLANWDLEISKNEILQSFLLSNIESMPYEFNKDFFKKQLYALISLKKKGIPRPRINNFYNILKQKLPDQLIQQIKDIKRLRPQRVRIKHSFLIMRAVVLSKWFSILFN